MKSGSRILLPTEPIFVRCFLAESYHKPCTCTMYLIFISTSACLREIISVSYGIPGVRVTLNLEPRH